MYMHVTAQARNGEGDVIVLYTITIGIQYYTSIAVLKYVPI